MHLIEFWQVVFSQPHDGTRKMICNPDGQWVFPYRYLDGYIIKDDKYHFAPRTLLIEKIQIINKTEFILITEEKWNDDNCFYCNTRLMRCPSSTIVRFFQQLLTGLDDWEKIIIEHQKTEDVPEIENFRKKVEELLIPPSDDVIMDEFKNLQYHFQCWEWLKIFDINRYEYKNNKNKYIFIHKIDVNSDNENYDRYFMCCYFDDIIQKFVDYIQNMEKFVDACNKLSYYTWNKTVKYDSDFRRDVIDIKWERKTLDVNIDMANLYILEFWRSPYHNEKINGLYKKDGKYHSIYECDIEGVAIINYYEYIIKLKDRDEYFYLNKNMRYQYNKTPYKFAPNELQKKFPEMHIMNNIDLSQHIKHIEEIKSLNITFDDIQEDIMNFEKHLVNMIDNNKDFIANMPDFKYMGISSMQNHNNMLEIYFNCHYDNIAEMKKEITTKIINDLKDWRQIIHHHDDDTIVRFEIWLSCKQI